MGHCKEMEKFHILLCLLLFITTTILCSGDLKTPEKNSDENVEEMSTDNEVGSQSESEYMQSIKSALNEQINELKEYVTVMEKNARGKAVGTEEGDDSHANLNSEQAVSMKVFLKDFNENLAQVLSESSENIDTTEEDVDTSSEQEPIEEKTPEQLYAQDLYETAMVSLQKNRNNRQAAYKMLQEAAATGHVGARLKLAWAYLFGDTLPQDIQTAMDAFVELAATGNANAHAGLGLMYASGIGVPVSGSRALVHLTLGALGGDSWAQMSLAYRYWSGVQVAPSCEQALQYYKKVAFTVASDVSLSGGPAIQRIRLLDEQENTGMSTGILDNDLIEYYQLLAEKGDIQAQVGLGQLHYQGGRGVQLDLQKALHYFQQAANAGNAVAMAFLGKIYLEGGEGISASNETALQYFKRAAELNNPVGQSGLGLMYLQGRVVPRDTARALHYFSLAADQGWVDGQLHLANMYYSGLGVRRDFKMANKYFSLASQSGHVLAFYHLGQMHAQGMGVTRSCPTAVELFKNVAERGKWAENLMMAHSASRQYEDKAAYVQYAVMAELGYEVAQSNAAYLLDRDQVSLFTDATEKYVRALMYWGRAASQGYSPARVKLGDYHYYGLGTAVDYETAASHYRLASEQQHNPQATFNLGYMHELGLGMRRDAHLAKRCYDLAAETSHDAHLPVALALIKLNIVFGLEALKDSQLAFLLVTGESSIISNWDIYLITALSGVLGLIIYFRRPRQPGN